jgi:purine-nucleoside phosphorylase
MRINNSMLLTQIEEASNFLKTQKVENPIIGIILGTGLGGLVEKIDTILEIPYENIPHFPKSTVESHSGKLIYGLINNKKILAMQGRFHYYEEYSMQQITFPVRVMKSLGVKHLLISNAGGAINLNFKKGQLMLIDDHINLLPDSPLRGISDPKLGPRFVDLSNPYSDEMNAKLLKIAKKLNIPLNQGVYVAVPGPNLETRAEYRYLGMIGADVVGMSTIPEVIVANQIGLPCCAVSVLTDECDPDKLEPVEISEILKIAGKAEKILTQLYVELINQI